MQSLDHRPATCDCPGTPLASDWDGNGIDTVGFYNAGTYLLRNEHAGGAADLSFSFGSGASNIIPVAGDWDGDGVDTIGFYEPINSVFFLRNSNSAGAADLSPQFGPANGGWKPIVGDWDSNGTDTIGLWDPINSVFYLKNTFAPGAADITAQFGPTNSGWTPLAGDWNADGGASIGYFSPSNNNFLLKNTNSAGAADLVFQFGPTNSGWLPIIGDWDAVSAQSASGLGSGTSESLTQGALNEVIDAALARWAGTGLDLASVTQLSNVQVRLGDLEGTGLGAHSPGLIVIDADAAGHGWFVDLTPESDEEFTGMNGDLGGRMDLLSTVLHEMGHELGLDDVEADNVMRASLTSDTRLLALDEAFAA